MKYSVSDDLIYSHYPVKDVLKLVKDAGFDCDDMMLHRYDRYSDHRTESVDEVKKYFKNLKSYADGIGLGFFQTHAPFGTQTNRSDKEAMFTSLKNSIIATSVLGAKYVIIHPHTNRIFHFNWAKNMRMNDNYKFYKSLEPVAKDYGVKIALENMFTNTMLPPGKKCCTSLSTTEEDIEMLARLDSDAFGFCLDIGHFNLLRDDPVNAIRELGNRITCVHLHDNDGMDDRHVIPGEGIMNWEEICKALDEVGFDGVINLEVGSSVAKGGKYAIPENLKKVYEVAKSLPFAKR